MLQLTRPTRTGWRFLGDSRLTGMNEAAGALVACRESYATRAADR
jgi:hypothetical protein